MARGNSSRPPSYRLHKPSGQSVVTIAGKDHYLGKHGTPESRLRYEKHITAWMGGTEPVPAAEPGDGLTVAELCIAFLRWAEEYYRKDDRPTTELKNVKRAIKALRGLYASLPAREFSPLKLKAVRDRLVADELARTNVNRFTRHVVRVFGWGVENELIPAETWHALKSVKALAKGRCKAPETAPVLAVDEETIEATLRHLDPATQAMVRIQVLLACRPGELCSMRPCDIDRSDAVWLYRPESHKTEHHDRDRIIPIGPRAQLLLRPLLPDFAGQHVFRGGRGKPMTPNLFGLRIAVACRKAGIDRWAPNRLRHAGATRIRRQASLDAAQVILGHSSVSTTQVYAERNLEAAKRIAAEVG